jgi:hypothetical protein
MAKCPFYQVHMHRPSGVAGSQLKPDRLDPFPWCSHAHSTVPLRVATEARTGEHKLNCGGDLARCQVAAQWRPTSED